MGRWPQIRSSQTTRTWRTRSILIKMCICRHSIGMPRRGQRRRGRLRMRENYHRSHKNCDGSFWLLFVMFRDLFRLAMSIFDCVALCFVSFLFVPSLFLFHSVRRRCCLGCFSDSEDVSQMCLGYSFIQSAQCPFSFSSLFHFTKAVGR